MIEITALGALFVILVVGAPIVGALMAIRALRYALQGDKRERNVALALGVVYVILGYSAAYLVNILRSTAP